MEENFEQLVAALAISPLSTTAVNRIACILEEQTYQSIPSFVSNSLKSLVTLEHWAWQILSQDFRRWIDEEGYYELFLALHSWNMKLISITDAVQIDTKTALLIPSSNEWINGVFDQITTGHDTFLTVASLWFDLLAYLILEQQEVAYSPVIIHLNSRLSRDFVMTNEYKSYLQHLRKPNISQIVFTKKQMFYLKTCSFSLNVYFSSKSQNFPFTGRDIIEFLGDDYSQMILVQSNTCDSWSTELLSCIAHLTAFICSTCWWSDKKAEHIEIIIPSGDPNHTLLLAFIRILNHEPLRRSICTPLYNDENLLIGATLILLLGAIETQDVGCFITSETNLPATLLTIAQKASNDRILLYTYGFLAAILSNEQLKDLKISDNICKFLFDALEQAWKHPTKKWRRIPIPHFLKGILSLSINDTIQTTTAHLKKVSLLIEMCDHYPMVYDILWSLSFNTSIKAQIQSNPAFMTKLAKLGDVSTDLNIRRSVNGILWLLDSSHDENIVSSNGNDIKFDVMISYSHKDKQICKQVYDELIQAGYRIWIDFDQMHGNLMDAMAQAIEQSRVIVICMSEHYQRSNICRAEAQYAFQRKLKMVPILLQKHYKPSGWLSFLISQLLYIDFTKLEFPKAIELLFKELKSTHLPDKALTALVPWKTNPPKQLSSERTALPKNIRDWTNSHVHTWLTENNLPQMACILSDVDGPGLIYMGEYIINGEPQQILLSLQQDSRQRVNEAVSLVEVARFRSLIEREGLVTKTSVKRFTNANHTITNSEHSQCCNIM